MSQAGVTCRDCHAPGEGQIQRTQASTCVACHEASYSDTLRVWQQDGNLLLASVEQRMKSLIPESEIYRNYAELAAALSRDRSQTVHNPKLFRMWVRRIEIAP
jgi:hypothetical protein